jgi:hypothetical protein
MAISTYVRFTGGPETPGKPGESPSPGGEIVRHLVATLPALGVAVGNPEDIQYAHELPCTVHGKSYALLVSYDWVIDGWWEIFYCPRLSWIQRLFGSSEQEEMRALTAALDSAVGRLPGLGEVRWYPTYNPAGSNYRHRPET